MLTRRYRSLPGLVAGALFEGELAGAVAPGALMIGLLESSTGARLELLTGFIP
jgi:hypothetical protein